MTELNRPWIYSFRLETFVFSDASLDQFHKLCRNFVASLDLGCPSAKHVKVANGKDVSKLTERERYLLWVGDWKKIYSALSRDIRFLKTCRRTVRFPKLTTRQADGFTVATNLTVTGYANAHAAKHLERLQETAQAMLNARYNAKLASAERWRRTRPQPVSDPVTQAEMAVA